MDFAFTDEHEMVRKMVRDFAERELAPTVKEHDRNQTFDRGVFAKMAELGLLGICIPVKYGGAGMDYISLGLVSEELERIDTAYRVIMSVHVGLNSLALLQWATEEQKQKYLVPQALGQKIATYGLTEPNAGCDAARPADHGAARGRSLYPQRRKDVDFAGRCRRSFHRLCLDRSGEKARAPGFGHVGLYHRARLSPA